MAEKQTEWMNVQMPVEQKRWLQALADRQHRTLSDQIRFILALYREQYDDDTRAAA